MPTANHDASRVTQRKRAVAMYTWNAANNAAISAGNSVRREQPDTQLGELLAYRRSTKAYFTPNDPSTGLPKNCSSCTAEVVDYPTGGGVSNNVQ